MARCEDHCAESIQLSGPPYEEVHRWRDAFAVSPEYGYRHVPHDGKGATAQLPYGVGSLNHPCCLRPALLPLPQAQTRHQREAAPSRSLLLVSASDMIGRTALVYIVAVVPSPQ